jgi:S1-C subfamily serine protease
MALPLLGVPLFAQADGFMASVVKVRAVDADGSATFGSAVVIGPERLATTCHVTRQAKIVEVSQGSDRWVAESQVGSLAHDLCMITVRNLHLPIIPIRSSSGLHLGERVTAVGFQGGGEELVIGEGTVEGLYRYDDGQVIRTSAPFDFGSSGGGLFDEAGNLVGLLAFKGRSGEKLRFALPTDWISAGSLVVSTFEPIVPASKPIAFWERPRSSQPAFLGVAIREAAVHKN